MKKILIISLVAFALDSFGQSFKGVASLGISGNQIDGDVQGGYHHLGVFAYSGVELKLDDNLFFSVQGGFLTKGARNSVLNTSLNLVYLELPLQVYYKLENFSVGGGGYLGYLVRAKLKSGTYKVDRLDLLQKRDVGVLGQIGYDVNESTVVFLRGEYSIFSIRKDNVYWRNNSLSLGIKIALN